MAKLDRDLVSDTWEARFSLSNAYSTPRPVSDHAPIYLDSGENIPKTSKLFRFEKWWLQHDEVHKIIHENWSLPIKGRDAAEIICEKLRRL